jgi:hypothetical protein
MRSKRRPLTTTKNQLQRATRRKTRPVSNQGLEIWSQVLTGKTAKPGKVVPLQAKRAVA